MCPLLGKAAVWRAFWKVEWSQSEAQGKRAKSSCSSPTQAKSLGNEGNCLTSTLSAHVPAGEEIRCRQMTQGKDALGRNGLSACERQKDVQVREALTSMESRIQKAPAATSTTQVSSAVLRPGQEGTEVWEAENCLESRPLIHSSSTCDCFSYHILWHSKNKAKN